MTSRCELLQQLIQHVDISVIVQMRHRPAVLVVLGQAAVDHRHHLVHIAGALRLAQTLQANFGRDADLVVMVDCQIPSDDLIVHFF